MLTRSLTLLLLCSVALAAADYDEAYHPDGSLHYKIKLDRDGLRHGKFVRYHPGGSEGKKGPKAEVGGYHKGELHGVVSTLDADGTMLSEAQWVNGRCMLPMTERFISYRLKQIEAAARDSVAALPADGTKRPDPKTLVAVLTRLNHYRLLCGLDTDVVFDATAIHEAQCAAEVCAAMGRLDHHPKSNPGVSEERWEAGKTGCAKSNLAQGSIGTRAIDAWNDDSDNSNRDRLGHRRWQLWPELERFGYGEEGSFSAGHVIGGGGSSQADVPAVMFPPRGLMPLTMFGAHYCWHLSPDPKRYDVSKDAKLEIRPYDTQSGKTGEPIPIQYRNVNAAGFGGRPAIIAQPEQILLKRMGAFQVTVSGVSKKDANAPDLEWITIFY